MREVADANRIRSFLAALGRAAANDAVCYLTGGSTAVLLGWRDTTIDIDLRLEPATDSLLQTLARLKNDLHVNVELASPIDFIPAPRGWRTGACSLLARDS